MSPETIRRIEIVEVGPRDGLQNESTLLSTAQKLDFIDRLIAAGARRIEAASFVNPRRVPQMADSAAVMAAVPRDKGVSFIGLALNVRGAEKAIEAGCDEVNYVICASREFGIRNQGATAEESLAGLAHVAPMVAAAGRRLSATISVAFGCPFEGEVPESAVADIAAAAFAAGAGEIALGDTIGVADPWNVRARIHAVRAAAPGARLRLHFHNTRASALANAFAAIEAGVNVLDSSCGGIGGCPFAPKATGNVASEDLVYMLHRAGFETGLSLDALIATADWLESALAHPIPSALAKAGPFPGEKAAR